MGQRQQQITKYINENVLAGVDKLSTVFSVSVMTIRRDIDYLAGMHLLIKIKGGTKRLEKVEFFTRININITQKQDICREAFSFIHPGQSMFISGSTTVLPLAKLIAKNNPKVTVVTNSIFASIDLVKADKVRVINVVGPQY